jgi:NitT/TauT family transport system substrate-binding protein
MSFRKTLIIVGLVWIVAITFLHASLNLGLFHHEKTAKGGPPKFGVGFIPVTCHLTCPVTDFINQNLDGGSFFQPMRFNGFPELKETFLGKPQVMPATFILAPMAMALREQGVPIKIVYLGHRDGTAMMVHKDSKIFRIEDLKGKTVAVPSRFANQKLLLYKALRDRGMTINDITMVEMPPPDMPAALYSHSVDAITSGEPFMGQTELDGYGRILYLTKDVWPNFISCVLAVREETIRTRRLEVQQLVDGIAKSGKWLDQKMDHRMEAAQFVSKYYYHQDPRLLTFVLSKPPDRVKYTNLLPLRKDFEEIEMLGREAGILNGSAHFQDYADPSFADATQNLQAHAWEPAVRR